FFLIVTLLSIIWAICGKIPISVEGKCMVIESEQSNQVLGFASFLETNQIKPGMLVKCSFHAYPAEKYGVIIGKVEQVAKYPMGAEGAYIKEIPSKPLEEYLLGPDLSNVAINISVSSWETNKHKKIDVEPNMLGDMQIIL